MPRSRTPNRITFWREKRAAAVAPSKAFSVAEVAHRLGVTEWTLRSWELGQVRPNERNRKALAKELGVTESDLGLTDDTETDDTE